MRVSEYDHAAEAVPSQNLLGLRKSSDLRRICVRNHQESAADEVLSRRTLCAIRTVSAILFFTDAVSAATGATFPLPVPARSPSPWRNANGLGRIGIAGDLRRTFRLACSTYPNSHPPGRPIGTRLARNFRRSPNWATLHFKSGHQDPLGVTCLTSSSIHCSGRTSQCKMPGSANGAGSARHERSYA